MAPYAGHVAQLLGDGCLVYFGYPSAHEDDAGRAVHSALGVLRTVAALRPQGASRLQTRIGIATGLVVVGDIGTGTPWVLSLYDKQWQLREDYQTHTTPGQAG